MSNSNNAAGGSHPDLLSAIYGVQIRNDEKISEEDRAFCQTEQDKLYRSLEQIERWYDLLFEEAGKYNESHRHSYAPNGSVKTNEPYRSYEERTLDYTEFEFKPFDSINELVKANYQAHTAFANRIVSHFNDKYEVRVPMPDIDKATLPMKSRPVYNTYVDQVIEHLGGKSFRDTAEEELIKRFHEVVKPSAWSKVKPELKGDKITFPDIIHFDPFYYDNYKRHHIHYNYGKEIEMLCAGIAFGASDMLNGDSQMIIGFNGDDVSITDWYDLATGNDEQMKFFKNGRVDVKFKSAQRAEACFQKLQLHEIELPNN